MVTVSQLMKRDLVTVDSGTSVVEAAKLMKACNVGSVLVAHDHQIIGIVTESDVVRKFVGADKGPYFVAVEDIMSSPIVGIEERRPLTEAADQGWRGGGHPLRPRFTPSCLHRRILAANRSGLFGSFCLSGFSIKNSNQMNQINQIDQTNQSTLAACSPRP
jgi:hypothetical protein